MDLFQAFLLGLVQGATEFLPISSSGHLVLVPAALDWNSPSLVFDATVHLATMLAVVLVFWKDICDIIRAWFRQLAVSKPFATPESRLGWWIIIGTIPGAMVGLLFEDTIEGFFGDPRAVGIFLLITALLLVLAELLGRRKRGLDSMSWKDSLLIGIGQAVAIAPGISRSGATMSVGMLMGMTRESAARFSFILALPIIFGAWLVQLIDIARQGGLGGEIPSLLVGFLAAGISGYLAIRWLLSYVRKHRLYPFAVYCVIVGILALVLL